VPDPQDPIFGGTNNSVFGYSHDADSLAFVDHSVVNGTFWWFTDDSAPAPVWSGLDNGPIQAIGVLDVDNFPEPPQVDCIERALGGGACTLQIVENRAWLFRLGYPQYPDVPPGHSHAFIAVSPMQVVTDTVTDWEQCSFDPASECRRIRDTQRIGDALVYRIEIGVASAEPELVDTIPGEYIFWIGQGESGEDAVLGRGDWSIKHWADPAVYHVTGSPYTNFTNTLESCHIEYRRRADFGTVIGNAIPAAAACNFGQFNFPSTGAGGGTIAPKIRSRMPKTGFDKARNGSQSIRRPVMEILPSGVRALGS
jgi:hypothetical protein